MPAARKNPGLQARVPQHSSTAPHSGADQEMGDDDVMTRWLQGPPVNQIQQLAEVARTYFNGNDGQPQDPSFTLPPTFFMPPNTPNFLAMARPSSFQDAANAILDDLDRLETQLQLPRGFTAPTPNFAPQQAFVHPTFAPQQTFVHAHGVLRPTAAVHNTHPQTLPAHTICPTPNVQINVGSRHATTQHDQGNNVSSGRQQGRFVPQPHNTMGAPNAFTAPPTSIGQSVWGANNLPAPNNMQVSGPTAHARGTVHPSNASTPRSTPTAGSASFPSNSTRSRPTAVPAINQAAPTMQAPPTPARPAKRMRRRTVAASQGRLMAGKNGYGDDLMRRTPFGTLPIADEAISAVEILIFCPRWLHHPSVVLRLAKAGWKREDMARLQLHGIIHDAALDYDTMHKVIDRVQKQLSIAGKLHCPMAKGEIWRTDKKLAKVAFFDDLTSNNWKARYDYDHKTQIPWEPVKLADIAAPIINWPQGDDALLFTQCLRYAAAHPQMNYTTADCAKIIREQGFTVPPTAFPLDHTHDEKALARFKASGIPSPAETAEAKAKREGQEQKSKENARARAQQRDEDDSDNDDDQ